MNTKNIVIVNKSNTAIAVGKDGVIAEVNSTGGFLANFELVNKILADIPVEFNAAEIVNICVPDCIQAITSGKAIDYLRTGKTSGGRTGENRTLTPEEMAAVKEFYSLYGERILNVKFGILKYASKDNVELQSIKTQAWAELDKRLQNSVVGGTVVDTDKAIREALDAQIIEAINSGNIALMKELKEVRDSLAKPQVVGGYTPKLNKTPEFTDINPFADVEAELKGEASDFVVEDMSWDAEL